MNNTQALAVAEFMDAMCASTFLRRDVDPEVKQRMALAMDKFAQFSGLERRNMRWVVPQESTWSDLRLKEGLKHKP